MRINRPTRLTSRVLVAVAALGLTGACGSTRSVGAGRSVTASTSGGAPGHPGPNPPARLTVIYRPHGAYPAPGQFNPTLRWTLWCRPPGGSHPARVAACGELVGHADELFRPGLRCLVIVRGAPSASVSGVVGGRRVRFVASTCSPAWRRLHALLTGSG